MRRSNIFNNIRYIRRDYDVRVPDDPDLYLIDIDIDHTKITNDLYDFPIRLRLDRSIKSHTHLFNELADTPNINKCFHGYNFYLPDENIWEIRYDQTDANTTSLGDVYIDNNSLRFKIDNAISFPMVVSKFKLHGDFDIYIDFSMMSLPSPDSDWSVAIWLQDNNDNVITPTSSEQQCAIGSYDTSHGPFRTSTTNMSAVQGGPRMLAGKFRCIRQNKLLQTQYWNGDNWITLLTDTSFTTKPLYLKLQARTWSAAKDLDCTFSNLSIIADNITWDDYLIDKRKNLKLLYDQSNLIYKHYNESIKLLIQADDVYDESIYSKSIEIHGAAISDEETISGFSVLKFSSANNNYLFLSDSTDWDIGTKDFTIDFRVYSTDVINKHVILSTSGSSQVDNGLSIYIDNNDIKINNGPTLLISHSISANTWYHIAFVCQNSTLILYMDGISVGTANINNILYPNTGLVIGKCYTGTDDYYFDGYLSCIRLTHEAEWSTDFTPNTTIYKKTTQNKQICDAYTKILLSSDTYDGDKRFKNESRSIDNPINLSVIHSSNKYKFGKSSIAFDGTDKQLYWDSNPLFDIKDKDLTIDFYINFNSVGGYQRIISRHDGTNGWLLTVENSTNKINWTSTGNSTLTSNIDLAIDTWYHVAFVIHNGTQSIYINGQLDVSSTFSGNVYDTATTLQIGKLATQSYFLNATIDKIRLSIGIARWVDDFQPPLCRDYYQTIDNNCYMEIEKFNPYTAEIWAKIPYISNLRNTKLSLYYNKRWRNENLPSIQNIDDNFDAADGTYPDLKKWYSSITSGNTCIIDNNSLKFTNIASAETNELTNYTTINKNVTATIDIDVTGYNNVNCWITGIRFRLLYNNSKDLDDLYEVGLEYCGDDLRYVFKYRINNTWNTTYIVTSNTTAHVKIERIGSNFYGYYYDNGWQLIGNHDYGDNAIPIIIDLINNTWSNYPAHTGYIDNFIIEKGQLLPHINDDFIGINGTKPDASIWELLGTDNNAFIDNNSIQMSGNNWQAIRLRYELIGDYDVITRVDVSTCPSINSWAAEIIVVYDDYTMLACSRRYSGNTHYYSSEKRIKGVWSNIQMSAATTDTDCILRVKRSSKTIYFYYWDGSDWVLNGTYNEQINHTDCRIWLSHGPYDNNPSFTVNYQYFKLLYAEKLYIDTKETTKYIDDLGRKTANNVWDENHIGVFHLSQNPEQTGACILDSTKYMNHGTPNGDMTIGDLKSGIIGNSLYFDGINDYINCDNGFDCLDTLSHTIEASYTLYNSTQDNYVIGKGTVSNTNQSLHFGNRASSTTATYAYFGNDIDATLLSQSGETYYQVGTQDNTGRRIYVDGVLSNSDSNTSVLNTAGQDLYIGQTSTHNATDFIDEIRISNIPRSYAWIKATYHSNTNTLLSFPVKKYTWLSDDDNNEYKYRIKITLDYMNLDSELLDFPVLVNLSRKAGVNDFDSFDIFDILNENFNKIVFEWPGRQEHYVHNIKYTNDTIARQRLYAEVAYWNTDTCTAQIWVKIPKILNDQPIDIYLYYDNDKNDNPYIGETGSEAAENVWDDNFVSVYHMAQDPSMSGACILDSTKYMNHGTPNGSMTKDDLVDGPIGKALKFDGVDDYINIGNIMDSTQNWTLEAHIDLTGGGVLISDGYPNVVEAKMQVYTYLNAGFYNGNWHEYSNNFTTDTVGNQHFIASTYDGAQISLFQDDEIATFSENNTTSSDTTDWYIGRRWDTAYNNYVSGKVMEVRISDIARSVDWLTLMYYNDIDNLLSYQYDKYSLQDCNETFSFSISADELNQELIDFPVAVYLNNKNGASELLKNIVDITTYNIDGNLLTHHKLGNHFRNSAIKYFENAYDVIHYTDYDYFNGISSRYGLVDCSQIMNDYGDETNIAIAIRFKPYNIEKGVQSLWKSGGHSNGIAVGIDNNASIIFAGRNSGTLTYCGFDEIKNNEWYWFIAEQDKITLLDDEYHLIARKYCNIIPGDGSSPESIGCSCQSSPITAIQATTNEFFDGAISDIKIYQKNTVSIKPIYKKTNFIITDNDNKPVYCEIETYERDLIKLWIKTTLSNVFDNNFTLHLKKSVISYTGNIKSYPAKQVWDNNFVFVCHMNTIINNSFPSILDSTDRDNNLTPFNLTDYNNIHNHERGAGIIFDGSSTYMIFNTVNDMNPDTLTVEAHISGTTYSNTNIDCFIVDRSISGNAGYDLNCSQNGTRFCLQDGAVACRTIHTTKGINNQYVLAGTYDLQELIVFFNGIIENKSAYTSAIDYTNVRQQLGRGDTGHYFDGIMYDVRISNIARSIEWIRVAKLSYIDNLIQYPVAPIYDGLEGWNE